MIAINVNNHRDLFNSSIKLKKIIIGNSYPEYIKKNKKKLRKWIA